MKELESLKQQVAASSFTQPQPAVSPAKPDTVYIIQRQEVFRERPLWVEVPVNSETTNQANERTQDTSGKTVLESEKKGGLATSNDGRNNLQSELVPEIDEKEIPERVAQEDKITPAPTNKEVPEKKAGTEGSSNEIPDTKKERVAAANTNQRSGDAGSPPTTTINSSEQTAAPAPIQLANLTPVTTQKPVIQGQDYQRRLLKRMPHIASATQKGEEIKRTQSVERIKSTQKTERLLPDFNLNIPYRIGLGQQWEGRTNAFSVWNEVLLGKHWAIQGGLSWKKLEDQKFFSEKTFRDMKREDFRKDNAQRLPPNFKIFNIITKTTLMQLPLNLVYRDEIRKDFAYFIGVGTNLNLSAKQVVSFDFERPTSDFGQQSKQRKAPIPLINNFAVLAGIEKRWSPIILQVDSYITTRTKLMPYLPDRTSVGLRVKLLYEFGGGGKN
jgi:hypothetical protein